MKARGAVAAAVVLLVAGTALWLLGSGAERGETVASVLVGPAGASSPRGPDLPEPAAESRASSSAPPVTVPSRGAPHLPGIVVRRSDGSALRGASVTLVTDDEAQPLAEPASTAADGRFDLPLEVAPDVAHLRVSWTASARILEDGLEVEAPLGVLARAEVELARDVFTSGVPIRVELDTGWMIGGTVTDGRGQPVHAARLFAEAAGATAESDRAGAFLMRDVPPDLGSVSILVHGPGRQVRTVTVDAPAPGADRAAVLIELPECASLSGLVVDESGVPFDDIEVFVAGADSVAPGPRVARTGQDGRFAFEGLAEGRYDLVARIDDEGAQRAGAPAAASETWVHDVRLTCGPNRDVRLVVGDGVWQRGRVLDHRGRPLTNHVVAARVVRNVPCHPIVLGPAASAETDSTGSFALRRLAPGPWELTVQGIPGACAHGDGGEWRALATRGPPAALAQDGAPGGPPRPVELRREVEVAHVATDVELVVPQLGEHPEWSLQGWPQLHVCLIKGSYPLIDGARLEIWDTQRRAVGEPQLGIPDIFLPITAETASGLLVFAAPGCLSRITVLHHAQLENDFGQLVLEEAPKLELRLRAAEGSVLDGGEVAVHWFGGGRPEWVDFRDAGSSRLGLYANRREGSFEVTVSAPDRRRWRKAGLIPPAGEPLKFDVELPRW